MTQQEHSQEKDARQENAQPLNVHLTEAAAKKLADDPRAREALERKNPAFGKLDSAHSTGRRNRSIGASNRQGKREKKVRW